MSNKKAQKKKKRSKRIQKEKLKKKVKKTAKADDEIVLHWSDRNSYDEVSIKKGIRFTPPKRRIIENHRNILRAYDDGDDAKL